MDSVQVHGDGVSLLGLQRCWGKEPCVPRTPCRVVMVGTWAWAHTYRVAVCLACGLSLRTGTHLPSTDYGQHMAQAPGLVSFILTTCCCGGRLVSPHLTGRLRLGRSCELSEGPATGGRAGGAAEPRLQLLRLTPLAAPTPGRHLACASAEPGSAWAPPHSHLLSSRLQVPGEACGFDSGTTPEGTRKPRSTKSLISESAVE